MLTVLVDYESGNLHSAQKAVEHCAANLRDEQTLVSSRPEDVSRADRVILPGDGAFPACKAALMDHSGLFDAIEERVIQAGVPFLGICIGMQMMATRGLEYQPTPGFDWIAGDVVPIDAPDLKVPHMGWNDLQISGDHPVLAGVNSGDHAYFVHSYHFKPAIPADRLAVVDYAGEVTAIVARDNMIGTQFHPEKSQSVGLRLLSNFLAWRP